MRYQLLEPVYNTLEIKKSQFITWLVPIENRGEAMEWIKKANKEYPDARHYCWAYVLGDSPNSQSAAMSDDGEPSGTAGKPMLNVLQHKPTNNVMAIVIRYFGGIKLGAGGLVRAYSQAVEQSYQLAKLQPVVLKTSISVTLSFADEQWLRHHLQQLEGHIESIEYNNGVLVSVLLPSDHVTKLTELLEAKSLEFKIIEK